MDEEWVDLRGGGWRRVQRDMKRSGHGAGELARHGHSGASRAMGWGGGEDGGSSRDERGRTTPEDSLGRGEHFSGNVICLCCNDVKVLPW